MSIQIQSSNVQKQVHEVDELRWK